MKMFRTMMIMAALLLPLTAAIAGPFEDGVAAYNKDNYETSVNLLWPLAEQGNASAQMWIGYMYDVGRGMPRSDVDAINWYKKAADQGNAFSQYRLGSLYANGRGKPLGDVEAV